jgi:DNA-binding transcriptional MocR family regulator
LATALRSELPWLRIRGIRAGLYLTLDLPENADESTIIAEGQRQSVSLYGTRVHYARPEAGPPGLLLGYCRLSERDAVEGVRRLVPLVKGGRFPERAEKGAIRSEKTKLGRARPI